MCSVNFNSVVRFLEGGVCAGGVQAVTFDQVLEDFFERHLLSLFEEFLVAAFGADLYVRHHEKLVLGVGEYDGADISAI